MPASKEISRHSVLGAVCRYFTAEWLHSFSRRYFWFYLPFLLGFCVGPVRQTMRTHALGSFFIQDFHFPWTSFIYDERAYAPERLGANDPNALDVQVTRAWRLQSGTAGDLYDDWSDMSGPMEAQADELRAQDALRKLAGSRPELSWLGTLRLLSAVHGASALNPYQEPSWAPPQRSPAVRLMDIAYTRSLPKAYIPPADELIDLADREAKRDAGNAFPLLVRAQLQMLRRQPDAAAKSLARAAKCPRYEDGSIRLAELLLRVYGRPRSLSTDERGAVLNLLLAPEGCTFSALQVGAARYARHLRHAGQLREALALGENLLRCGLLLIRQSKPESGGGKEYVSVAGVLFPDQLTGYHPGLILAETAFAPWQDPTGKAKTHPMVLFQRDFKKFGLSGQGKALLALHDQLPSGKGPNRGRNPLRVEPTKAVRDLSFGSLLLLVYGGWPLVVWWGAAIILYRGVGVPSSRRERLLVTVPLVVVSLCLILGSIYWLEVKDYYAAGPTNYRQEEVMGVAMITGMLLPVFGSLFVCAVSAWLRFRRVFQMSPWLSRELKLSWFNSWLLVHWVPVLATAAVLLLPVSAGLWAFATWYDWGPLDLLAWYPVPLNAAPLTFDYKFSDGIDAVYFCFLVVTVSVLFIIKWRWLTARTGRPATHFGLRWWKECLGGVLIAIAWIYLAVNLLSWPWQQAMERDIQRPVGGSYLLARYEGTR